MEEFTKKGLRTSWGDKELVRKRAKRGKGTSAPTKKEMSVTEKYFNIAKKKNMKTLVLGATPELRDLAIKLGSETTAVDISPKLTLALTNIMKYKDNDKNKFIIDDWLEMHKFFRKNSFDVILADFSINNIPLKKWKQLLKICSYLLKKDGHFITRHFNYNNLKIKPYKEIINEFNKGNNNPFGLIVELCVRSELGRKGYDHKTRVFNWSVLLDYDNLVKKHLKKTEKKYFESLILHVKYVKTFTITKKEFEKLVKKSFLIKEIGIVKDLPYSKYMPIYFLKNKKLRFLN